MRREGACWLIQCLHGRILNMIKAKRGRPRKIVIEEHLQAEVQEMTAAPKIVPETKKIVAELTSTYDRGDLNEIREKINEIIRHLNS